MNNSARLKFIRESLGFTQREMADELKVTNGAVALWESGRRPVPGPILRLIELYEDELGISNISSERESIENFVVIPDRHRDLRGLKLGSLLAMEWVSSTLMAVFSSNSQKSVLQKRTFISMTNTLLKELDQMKGLPMKMGQLLSYLSFSMPPEAQKSLAHLQSHSSPVSKSEIESVFCSEFLKTPSDVFRKWNSKPFAIASLGQVHLAKLPSGETVAVKIQFPKIKDHLQADLKTVNKFAPLLRLMVNQKEPNGIFTELSERLIEECDYTIEAQNQLKFAELFADNNKMNIPKIFLNYCKQKVLCSEYCNGLSYREFLQTSSQAERQNAAEVIWQFSFESIFKHGILNSDPQPGNYLFSEEKITFLDFGSVKRFSPQFIEIWKQLFISVVEKKEKLSIQKLKEIGVLESTDGIDQDHLIRLLNTIYAAYVDKTTFTFTKDYLSKTFNLWFRHNPNRDKMKFPKDWLYLTRALWGVSAILADLNAEATWRQKALDIIHDRPTLSIGQK